MRNFIARIATAVTAGTALAGCSPSADVKTVEISSETPGITVVTVFIPKDDKFSEALDLLQQGVAQEISTRPGYISSAIHSNIEETYILSYARWNDRAAFDAALEYVKSGQAPLTAKAETLAVPDFHPYTVTSIHLAK